MIRLAIAIGVLVLICGCGILPQAVQQPQIHNPFPQLTKVAVAPFFNLSTEPTVDGRQFGLDYFAALQSIPGFEVVPVGVVEKAMQANNIQLNGPQQARQLAQILGVDAVVIGAVTDFSPYYPPHCGLQVEWYAANAGFHPVPPGYGLPWGTKEEEYIPPPLKLEAEMALARAQLATQTPQPDPNLTPVPSQANKSHEALILPAVAAAPAAVLLPPDRNKQDLHGVTRQQSKQNGSNIAVAGGPNAPTAVGANGVTGVAGTGGIVATATTANSNTSVDSKVTTASAMDSPGEAELPPDWPDPRGFVPPPPSPQRPPYIPCNEPVLRQARIYTGNDADFTSALENFSYSRDDARKDGWQGSLQRSDEFIRFCCYKSIAEMLTARGGAGESKVVYRWERDR
ncbi:MAG TPA: hypothetical protein VFE46_07885 [Pirellulales bacterium]|jgi:hypothetical protein|nr:hypothetical protein [Pirellulales bacterium]